MDVTLNRLAPGSETAASGPLRRVSHDWVQGVAVSLVLSQCSTRLSGVKRTTPVTAVA